MATYLDYLSRLTNEDDENDDKLSNEYAELLNSLLFNYTPYVLLICNWRHTGNFDINVARQCIIHIWKQANGVADIKHCCICFAESLDDFVVLAPMLTPLFKQLVKKYSNL